jgi:hypothetical protein
MTCVTRELASSWPTASTFVPTQLMLGYADIKQTQHYLNISDEELRKTRRQGSGSAAN